MADLKEELGDLQLQVVYHARIAEERGAFGIDDVMASIPAKMIRRHPHIFGDEAASPGSEALKSGERDSYAAKSSLAHVAPAQTGIASCRERVCPYVLFWVVSGSF